MKTNLLKLRRTLRLILSVLLFGIVGIKNVSAYDFSANCASGMGKTLYYSITDATNHYVSVVYPGISSSNPWDGYQKPLGNIVIPNTVENGGIEYLVTGIGGSAFYGCTGLTSLTIPNSVTIMEGSAFRGCTGLTTVYWNAFNVTSYPNLVSSNPFYNCTNLSTVVFGDSVETIPGLAFRGCSSLTSLTIGNSVTSINGSAFRGCSSLTSLTIPNSVTSIGGSAFFECNGLALLTIGNSVTSIGAEAFSGCSGLTSLTLPNSLTSIGWDAFYGCSGLTSLTIPNSVTSIGTNAFEECSGLTTVYWDAINVTDCDDPFYNCTNLNTVIFGDAVETIPAGAFYECSSMTSLTIGNSVTSIGGSAFRGCSGLTTLTIPNSVTSIGGDAFFECSGLTTIYWNAINVTVCNAYFYTCTNLSTVVFGDSVETIPAVAFYKCSGLTSLTIPNSVMSIGSSAFYECSGLTSLIIGNSVASIGSEAFSGCIGLKTLTIGNSVTSIDSQAFFECSGLTSLTIPNSVTSIGTQAFCGCSGLTTLTIGNSVTNIGSQAFSGCSGLTTLTIPNSVTSIETYAFSECSELTTVYWDAINVTSYPSNFSKNPFINCANLTTVVFGDSVETIPAYAFLEFQGLTFLTIGNSVTSIGARAFCGCSGLTTVYWNATNVTNYPSDSYYHPFRNCTNLSIVVFGDSVETIPASAFSGYSGLTSLTLGNSVTSIGSSAFQGCSGLTSLTIPNSVTSIGNSAFYGCSGLTGSLTIPNSMTIIGNSAFYGCSGLTGPLTIPNSVTSIGNYAFYGCSELTGSLTIGNSVTSMGNNAFMNCSGLTGSLTIPNSVTSIGSGVFYGCSGLTSLTIPNSVTSIGADAFYGCGGLASLTIPNSVTSIGADAFSGCSGLTSLTIPTSVTSIDNYAFYGCSGLSAVYWDANNITSYPSNSSKNPFGNCTNLSTVVFGDYVHTIPAYAFYGCSGLTTVYWNAVNVTSYPSASYNPFYNCTNLSTVVFGDSVGTIPAYAFYGCSGLTSLMIGNSVTNIGLAAFSSCSGLTGSLTIPNSVTSIGNSAFYGCSGLTGALTIPNSVVTIGTYAYRGCSGLTTVYWNAVNVSNYPSASYNPFDNCTNLSVVVFGDSVEAIPAYAFYEFGGLASMTIGNSVTSIGDYAFKGCSGLTTVNWNAVNVSNYPSAPYNPFYNCTNLSAVAFGDSVEIIPNYAFCECSGLTSLTIGNSVTNIRAEAFRGCSGLASMTVNAETPPTVGYNAFVNVNKSIPVNVPCSTVAAYQAAESWIQFTNYQIDDECPIEFADENVKAICVANWDTNEDGELSYAEAAAVTDLSMVFAHKNIVSFDELQYFSGLTEIGDSAFSGCGNMTSVVLPNSITTIGENAFINCNSLASITIGNSVAYIEDGAFNSCNGLISVYYTGNITQLCNITFEDYDSNPLSGFPYSTNGNFYINNQLVTDVVIPETIAEIKDYTFYNFDCLTSITIHSGITTFGYHAFCGCENLGSVYYTGDVAQWCNITFEDSVSNPLYYADYLFINGDLVTDLIIPETITEIKDYAFNSFSGFNGSITIPSSVTIFGRGAFNACQGLNSLYYMGNMEQWCNITFSSWYSNPLSCAHNFYINGELVTDLVIPETITEIKDFVFHGCWSLTGSLIIGNTVTSIGVGAFDNCINISSVIIGDSVTSLGESSFDGCIGLTAVTIGSSVETIGNYAFYNLTYNGANIETMILNPINPPILSNYSLYGMNRSIPIYIPCGTMAAYQAADVWSEFTNYQEIGCPDLEITAIANPVAGGDVIGNGTYTQGSSCTLTATPNSGYVFVNWTENNEIVSTNATYQFMVSANRDLVANFEEYTITNHYVCDITQFADYMSVVAVVVVDGVEQESETLEIGAFCGDECRGGKFATYFPPTQRYIYQLPVYGAGGDNISFKLYNHDLQQELDLTCTVEMRWQKDGYGRLATPYEITFVSSVNISASVNPVNAGTVTGTGDYMPGETATLTATANEGYVFANWTEGANVVSENPVYSFTVDGERTLVANFDAAQSYTLSSGWNWWSTYIEQTGSDGLTMLEEGLGEHGEFIQSRTGAMVENFDGYFWWGDLNSVTNEDMYEVKTNAQVDVVITGSIADPTAHPITIAPGWNWIGYVSNASNSVDNAMSSLTPNADDIIQGRNGFSSYFPGWGWYGDIENMTPGQGYMYKSYGTASQTLVYPASTRSTQTAVVDYHYNVNYNKYRDVMDVIANVVLNGNMLDSDKYELAAFVDGECRGRAKLQYVEPLDTCLAFLTINGNANEKVTFSLYDENNGVSYNNYDIYVVFKPNEVVGKLRSPYTICFNGNKIETSGAFAVYPNPVTTGDEVTVNFSEDFSEGTLFIENELGLTVDVIKLYGKSEKIRFNLPSGVYVLRVVTDGSIYYDKVIVK